MDRILIRDLHIRCIIGANEWEHQEKQDIFINISLSVDTSIAVKSDNLADTVDYRELKREIIAIVEASSFNLMETLADRIAMVCLDHVKVREVTVTIDKPGALRFAKSAAVEITRRKAN